MRFCPECGGLVHILYAFQVARCQRCGREWALDRYELAIEAFQTAEDYRAAQIEQLEGLPG